MTTLSSDPVVVNSAISEAFKEAPVKIETVAPANNEVSLPGGYITPGGILVKYAEVKELNGSDEEAISRAGSLSKSLTTILQRGTLTIGGEPVEKNTLDDMLSADRDALLLAIRKVTFGNSVDYRVTCNCGVEQYVDIDLTTNPYTFTVFTENRQLISLFSSIYDVIN